MKKTTKISYYMAILLSFSGAALLLLNSPLWPGAKSTAESSNVLELIDADDSNTLKTDTKPSAEIVGTPIRLLVPAAEIDITVDNGYYDQQNQTWTLSEDRAYYATLSNKINNKEGNTLIYGHNLPSVFAALPQIQLGDKAYVYTDNGHKFTYSLHSTTETIPSDDSLFHYEGRPILTLQTCSGFWYQNRQLFFFKLEEVF